MREARAQLEMYLRDYAHLSGSVFQLAAWTCGETDLSMRSSFSMPDENNNSQNRDAVNALLSPSAAAMALRDGAAGAH
jgi:hypothetical protein